MSGFHGRGRKGFLYFAVLVLMGILLLVGLYFVTSYRHRHRQAYRYGGEEVAFHLARAGVAQISHAIDMATDPELMYRRFDLDGPLAHVLLNLPERITSLSQKINASGSTSEGNLDRLFGAAQLKQVREMAESYPGASLSFRVDFLPERFGDDRGYVDPVKKIVNVTIACTCVYRNTNRSMQATRRLRIYSLLPPVASKYTFFAPRLSEKGANQHPALGDGKAHGVYPAVCFHGEAYEGAGSGGSAMASAPTPGEFAKLLDDLEKRFEKRGWVFLGGSGNGIELRLEGGPPPWGQHWLLYRLPADAPASEARPLAYDLAEQPEGVSSLDARSLQDPTLKMRAWIRGAFWGYHQGQDPDAVLGGGAEEASSLRIFGSQEEPDPTLVGGRAYLGYGAFANLNVDRDVNGEDESEQERYYGREVEERDSIDPFFRFSSRSAFEGELAREASSPRPSYGALAPFQSHGLQEWFVLNLHGEAPSELNFQPLALDPAAFRYGLLFKDWEGYGRCMSKADRFPCNLAPLLMELDREPAFRLLESKSFGSVWEGDGFYDELLAEAPSIRNRDSLHALLGKEGAIHFDGEGRSAAELSSFDPLSFMPRTVTVWDQEEFELRFLQGGVLDLEGYRVVVRHPKTGVSRLRFEKPLALAARTGGCIDAAEIVLAGVQQVETEEDFSPLTIRAGDLQLLPGGMPHQAILRTASLRTGGSGAKSPDEIDLIHGSLFWEGGSFESRSRRLEVHWDERLDPGGPTTAHLYRLLPESPYPEHLDLDRKGAAE